MKVLMVPADETKSANPYNYLLNSALRSLGVTIESGTKFPGVLKRCQVYHAHWPHNFASQNDFYSSLRGSILLLCAIVFHKARRAKFVWTVHDHESLVVKHPRLERFLMKFVCRLVDGLIYFSERSKRYVENHYPVLKGKPFEIVAHGVYGSYYPNQNKRVATRGQLGISETAYVYAILGDIKSYKGFHKAIEYFRSSSDIFLLVAGRFGSDRYSQSLKQALQERVAGGENVIFVDRRLSDTELTDFLDAADVVLLPYIKSLNSGVGILAIERGKRLIGSSQPSFSDMQMELGSYWVSCVDEFDEKIWSEFGDRTMGQDDFDQRKRYLDERNWPSLAEKILSFYCRLSRGDD